MSELIHSSLSKYGWLSLNFTHIFKNLHDDLEHEFAIFCTVKQSRDHKKTFTGNFANSAQIFRLALCGVSCKTRFFERVCYCFSCRLCFQRGRMNQSARAFHDSLLVVLFMGVAHWLRRRQLRIMADISQQGEPTTE